MTYTQFKKTLGAIVLGAGILGISAGLGGGLALSKNQEFAGQREIDMIALRTDYQKLNEREIDTMKANIRKKYEDLGTTTTRQSACLAFASFPILIAGYFLLEWHR